MKKIGFIGAWDKSNVIVCVAKLLRLLKYKVLVIDTTSVQKIKYIIPAINPTKSYITEFEEIDFAVGFEKWEEIEKYLGIKFDSNADNEENEQNEISSDKKEQNIKGVNDIYDYVLLDIDSPEKFRNFNMQNADKKYFATSFDTFSLKKGLSVFEELQEPVQLTKMIFSYETPTKEEEEYLNFISMEYKVNWNDYVLYFRILGEDNQAFEESQRIEKIRFKKLSVNYKESLTYLMQDIDKKENASQIKKFLRD